MEKHIYFVRHGESDSNADRVMRGHAAILTENGREQARTVAERIARIGVEVLISSTFPRAIETARIIGERIGCVPEHNEIFGEWREPSHVMGKHADLPEVQSMYSAVHSSADPQYRHTDEETFAEMLARARAVLAALEQHPAKRICVVAHNGFLKILFGTMVFRDSFNKDMFIHMLRYLKLGNTGITYARFTNPERGWSIVTWNDQSHLG